MTHFTYAKFLALAAVLCLPPAVVLAQGLPRVKDTTSSARPPASGPTPRTPDGHPDLSGVWNGFADNLLGVPNQMHNVGIEVKNNSRERRFSGRKNRHISPQ